MHYLLLTLHFIYVFALAINPVQVDCDSQCIFTDNGCSPTVNTITNCGRAPLFNGKAPYGCRPDPSNPGKFISNKYTLPSYTIINPDINDNSCTNSSFQNKCTCKCEYNNSVNYCIPMTNEDFCGQNIKWSCPIGCNYNVALQECDPSINIYTCKLDKSVYPYKCPVNCKYDGYNKCIPSDQNTNTICDLTKKITCDSKCDRMNRCCTVGYDENNKQICIPSSFDYMNICEPTIKAVCPFGYYFDIDIPYCTRFNRNNLCKINNITVMYPTQISNNINIQCKYAINIDCENMIYGAIDSCCRNSKIDPLSNKCQSTKGFICGGYLLDCPINWPRIGNSWNCRGTVEPKCLDSQMLLNVTIFQRSPLNQYQILCGPRWYYG